MTSKPTDPSQARQAEPEGGVLPAPVRVERRTIDHIPASERRGQPNSLLTLWFASNVQVTGFATGLIATALGLDLKWAIISIVIGNMIGGLFMAYHSVQGPRLGVAQMIQSRAQFGFLGAMLPLVVVVLMYLGFFVTGVVLGGHALADLLHVPYDAGAIIASAVFLLVTWVGYDLFHAYDRFVAGLSALLFLAVMIKLLTSLPAHFTGSDVTGGTVLLAISIFVSWQLTWAPYVSDYSRYLPQQVSSQRVFWYTYFGSAVGASWVMIIGALAGAEAQSAASADSSGYLAGLFSGVKPLLLFVVFLGVVAANIENLYGGFLTLLAGISPSGIFRSGIRLRVGITTAMAVAGTAIAIAASSNFITNLTNFVLFLLYFLVPWTAINLTDYYLVRRGRYDIGELFKARGTYGFLNWWALGIYVATILIELPFMDTSIYVGPAANALGGADIAWLVGLAFAVGAYYLVARYELRRAATANASG
jgi:nucleobase:cation symporter-1, NCS1 family